MVFMRWLSLTTHSTAVDNEWLRQYVQSAVESIRNERSRSRSRTNQDADVWFQDLDSMEDCVLGDAFEECLGVADSASPIRMVFHCVDSAQHQFCRNQVLKAKFLNYFRDEIIPTDSRTAMCGFWSTYGARTWSITNYFLTSHLFGRPDEKWFCTPPLMVVQHPHGQLTNTWYVGAHKDATNLRVDAGEVHFFEPVPDFFGQVMDNFANRSLGATGFQPGDILHDFHFHNFGLGRAHRMSSVPVAAMQTSHLHVLEFLTDTIKDHSVHHESAPRNESSSFVIKSVRDVFFELFTSRYRFEIGEFPAVDVLHLNCMGCEYEIIHSLHNANLLRHIGVIQFLSVTALDDFELDDCILSADSGIVPSLMSEKTTRKFCQMEELLRQTHNLDWGLPWFQQRWSNKKLFEADRLEKKDIVAFVQSETESEIDLGCQRKVRFL